MLTGLTAFQAALDRLGVFSNIAGDHEIRAMRRRRLALATTFIPSSGRPVFRRIGAWPHTLVLIAYAVHVLTPVVHSVSLAREGCGERCPHAAGAGQSLWSPCGSAPCDNPHHHHHGAHDADHCAVCQSALTVHPPAPVSSFVCFHEPEVRQATCSTINLPNSLGLCSHLIRGPPAATVS